MNSTKVEACGATVSMMQGGWYCVDFWTRFEGRPRAEHVLFERMEWNEVQDTVDSMLASSRPGWAVGLGWSQPPLFD
jgi:hypothetical protein